MILAICGLFLLNVLFWPQLVVFWRSFRTRERAAVFYAVMVLACAAGIGSAQWREGAKSADPPQAVAAALTAASAAPSSPTAQASADASASANVTARQTPAATPLREGYSVGETATLDDVAVQVLKVEKSDGTEYDQPKPDMEYVIVTVALRNDGDETAVFAPYQFAMINSKGQKTDEDFSLIDMNTYLKSGELLPGGAVSGTLVFEQPQDDSGLVLVYQPSIWGGDEVRFNLLQTAASVEPIQVGTVIPDGDRLEVGEYGDLHYLTVRVKAVETSDKGLGYEDSGKEYIIVTVELKNTGDGEVSYAPYDFNMANSLGQVADHVMFTSVDDDTSLESGTLLPGGSVEGTVVFEEPVGDPLLTLIYRYNLLLYDDELLFNIR
jgi:hypothetical protein